MQLEDKDSYRNPVKRRQRRDQIFEQISKPRVTSEEWQLSMTLPEVPAPTVDDEIVSKELSQSMEKLRGEIRKPDAVNSLAQSRKLRRQATKQLLPQVQIDDLPAEVFLDILGRLSLGELAGRTNIVSKIWYDCSEEICKRFFQRMYASTDSFSPRGITNYARLVHRLLQIKFSSIDHIWKWSADNGFDLLWQRHALPLLIKESQDIPAAGGVPASQNLSAAPMWLESIIAAALRHRNVMLKVILEEFSRRVPNAAGLTPTSLLMLLGILSRDMDTLKLLMEGRSFPFLQQDLSEIMQETATAMGLSSHHAHLAASLRMICKAADSFGKGTSMLLLTKPVIYELIFICEHHKTMLDLLLTRCVTKRSFIDDLLCQLVAESRRSMVKQVLKYQPRQLRHILRVRADIDTNFLDNVVKTWPFGNRLEICAELLGFVLERDTSADCRLLRHVLYMSQLQKHPARVWAWYRSLWPDITRQPIHASIIGFLSVQQGALAGVINDLFEAAILSNAPGALPAIKALFQNKDAASTLDPLSAVFRICHIPDRFLLIEELLAIGRVNLQYCNPLTQDTIPLAVCRVARSKQSLCNWSYVLSWCARGVDINAISADHRSLMTYVTLEQNAQMLSFMVREQGAKQPLILQQLLAYFANQTAAAEKTAALQAISFVLRQPMCSGALLAATDSQSRNVYNTLKHLSTLPTNNAHLSEINETLEFLHTYSQYNPYTNSSRKGSIGSRALAAVTPRATGSVPIVSSSPSSSAAATAGRAASAPLTLSREAKPPSRGCTIL